MRNSAKDSVQMPFYCHMLDATPSGFAKLAYLLNQAGPVSQVCQVAKPPHLVAGSRSAESLQRALGRVNRWSVPPGVPVKMGASRRHGSKPRGSARREGCGLGWVGFGSECYLFAEKREFRRKTFGGATYACEQLDAVIQCFRFQTVNL